MPVNPAQLFENLANYAQLFALENLPEGFPEISLIHSFICGIYIPCFQVLLPLKVIFIKIVGNTSMDFI